MADQGPHHRPDVDSSLGTGGHHGGGRQGPVGRVGDDAERRERNPVFGRNTRRDMGFRVDRHGPGFFMQRTLGLGAGDRDVASGNIAE